LSATYLKFRAEGKVTILIFLDNNRKMVRTHAVTYQLIGNFRMLYQAHILVSVLKVSMFALGESAYVAVQFNESVLIGGSILKKTDFDDIGLWSSRSNYLVDLRG
jgi:hypothetical protein